MVAVVEANVIRRVVFNTLNRNRIDHNLNCRTVQNTDLQCLLLCIQPIEELLIGHLSVCAGDLRLVNGCKCDAKHQFHLLQCTYTLTVRGQQITVSVSFIPQNREINRPNLIVFKQLCQEVNSQHLQCQILLVCQRNLYLIGSGVSFHLRNFIAGLLIVQHIVNIADGRIVLNRFFQCDQRNFLNFRKQLLTVLCIRVITLGILFAARLILS